ncbi:MULTISPECIES: PLDc N-terminal domain-containing protein [Saccharopolyspora]|uniref:Cardiolipin synthase N-terminal domain-containing protein n=1 Tax=Saccharopolyspora gregorii TaxID=33914 RepID=A0ABP6RXS8_9PSEU|nr:MULTISPECIES: PLDc N-terminal domain-containing protein [Saccharopolyspora]MCA1188155.1 PLDc N-terminal domain-containing protein [Saccharopolyspora sp. 6T]MCA1195231.1 PLDc N-terminal domain-containing protein [Saccharopolyspora sp. 6V]
MSHFDPVAAFLTLFLIGYAIFFITAVTSVLTSGTGCGMTLVWLIVVCVAPILGGLLWFAVGREDARRRLRC